MVGILRNPLPLESGLSSGLSSGLDEPLIPAVSKATDSLSSDSDDVSDDEDEDSVNLDTGSMSAKEIIVAGVTAMLVVGGMAASAASIVAVPSLIVYIAGGICILNSPTVAKRQIDITRAKGTRFSINSLRTEVNILKLENDFLHGSVNELKSEVSTLGSLERNLQSIASEQQQNVTEIVNLVKENEEILNRMRYNLRQCIVSEMARIIVVSDRDRDMKVDVRDLPIITLRLRIQLETHGVTLDTRRFEEFIRKDNDIGHVLQFCNVLLFGDPDEEDDGSDDGSNDTDITFDFDELFGEVGEEQEENLKMFSIDEKYTHGSVEVARGKRMTVVKNTNTKRKTMVKDIKKRMTRMQGNRAIRMSNLGD